MEFLIKTAKRSGTIGAVDSVIAFVVNETEEWRIASAIKNGSFRPKNPIPNGYDSKFCQFSLDEVRTVVYNAPAKFGAFIGMKSTGKSTELYKFGSNIENKNIFFCELNGRIWMTFCMKPCIRV